MIFWFASAFAAEMTGTVVDAAGEPVANAYVLAYDRRLSYTYSTTDETGAYRIQDLQPGTYRMRVLPPNSSPLVERWYPEGYDACAAEKLTLEDSLDLAWQLTEGGGFSGRIEDELGNGRSGIRIIARFGGEAPLQPRYGDTSSDGSFTISGLPEDADTTLFALEARATGIPSQYVGGNYTDPMVVEVGVDEDVGSHVLLPGITVSGFVNGPSEARVSAYSGSQLVTIETEDGQYTATGLPPGEVLIWASGAGFAQTYWPDVDRPTERVSVLEEGAVVADLDVTMPPEAVLKGRIPDSDLDDNEGLSVLAYNDVRSVALSAVTDGNGNFEIHGLSDGSWSIYAYAANAGWVSGWVTAPLSSEPEIYELESGETLDLGDLNLQRGARVVGQVVDSVSGEPISGVWVRSSGVLTGSTQSAETDELGFYELRGLVADRHLLSVSSEPLCPSDNSWVTVYYEDMVNPLWAGGVIATGGESWTWNPAMPPDNDQDGMGDDWEERHDLALDSDDSALDPDEDGATNLEEYLLGSDPHQAETEPNSCACTHNGAYSVFSAGAALWAIQCRTRKRRV